MEVEPRYKLLEHCNTAYTTYTVYTAYTIQIALHCSNVACMPIC